MTPKFNECGFKSALSLGCGGRSYLGRLHTCTPYRTTRTAALEEIDRYQQTEDFSSVTNGILLSDDEIRRRYVIKHLLILPGISKQAYKKAFQADILKDYPIIKSWIDKGWLEESHGEIGYDDAGCNGASYDDANCNGASRDDVNCNGAGSYDADCSGANCGNGGRSDRNHDDAGHENISHDYIRLTQEGLGLSDYIGPKLIS